MRSLVIATAGTLLSGPLCRPCLAFRLGITDQAVGNAIARIQAVIAVAVSRGRPCVDCAVFTETYAMGAAARRTGQAADVTPSRAAENGQPGGACAVMLSLAATERRRLA